MSPPGVFQRPDLYCRQKWRTVQHINFGVDGARNLFTLSKKDRSGQQKSETSESMILYCLKKMHQEINDHYLKFSKQIQTIKELLGV